ncbi:50S ribosomal protein L4 [Candidatus Bathyarchaeota archaeon]|nr:50S ribosomal protein L4 [Candidatus Bathyarchaeota archaeon]
MEKRDLTDKVPIINLENETIAEVDLPKIFNTPLKNEVIKRAVISQQSRNFQPQGRDPMAGKRTTAISRGTGHGQARLPRLKQSSKAAFAVQAVGGHSAFPPLAEKNIIKKINKKEKRLAIRSGISASGKKEIVQLRGHKFDEKVNLPLVIDDAIEDIHKTKEVKDLLNLLGLWLDVQRSDRKKIRAGKGKMRGRIKKIGKGPLFVISNDNGISKAARNLPGVEVINLRNLNAEVLAPGAHPGRLVLWSKTAFLNLDKIWEEL